MSIMKKFFAGKKREEVSLAIIKTQTAVILKGEKIFDIYEDGNSNIRAKHKSGKWLKDRENLTDFYEFCCQFCSIDECHKSAQYYIQSHQLKKVGSIEFIPTPKESNDD